MRKKSHVSLIRLKRVLILFFIFASIFTIFNVNFDNKVIQFTEENQILYEENLFSSDQEEEIFKLIYGTDAGPTNLDPQNSLRPNSLDVINQVCEGLFTSNLSDPTFSIIPNLAISQGTWLVNLTDTWYTVSLRPNVLFHDGTKFNATAVKFTFDRIAYLINNSMTMLDYLYEYYDPDIGISYPIINKTVIIDEYTVRFELNKPYGPFETLLSFPGSFILSPTSTPNFTLIDVITGDLVGTGPFVYDHYILDDEVLFHAFDDYWAGRVNITILKFEINSDFVFSGSYDETYEKTYNFTTRDGANDGTWDYWNTDLGYHSVAARGTVQNWCWTDTGTPSTATGPPSGIACIYPETSSPTSVGDEYIAAIADGEVIDADIYDLYVTFKTCMRGDPAGHMYFEYWDGDSWEIKDDWQGDAISTFTTQGPYDFTDLENSDFKIRFRVVVGGTIFDNDFIFDDVRIYGDSKAFKVDVITDPPVSMFPTIIADPDVTLNEVGHDTTAQYLNMNNNKINATFRKAISYAINYSHIIDELQDNPSDRLKSPILENLLFANWSLDVATHNITKAREFMQSMGFGVGWDTVFPGISEVNWSSALFASFNYSYYLEDTFRHSLLFTLQGNLDKIGIEITDAGMSYTEFSDILYQKSGYTWDMWELCWLGWQMDYNDPDNFINPLFTNRTTSFNTAFYDGYLAANESGRDPFNLWDNVQLLMEAALFETNQSIRKPYYDRIQQILVEEDMPWAFGIVSRNYDAFRNHIIGFRSNPLGKLSFYGVTQNRSIAPQTIELSGNLEWQYFRSINRCNGQGTVFDPYVIEDLSIDGKASGSCILIENSDVYFKIENCTLYNSGGTSDGGIKLYNVSNGQLINNSVNNNGFIGINLINSDYNNVTGNIANNNTMGGIGLLNSNNNSISNNTANSNEGFGIGIGSSSYNTITNNTAILNSGHGIGLLDSSDIIILENTVMNNTLGGIGISSSTYISILNNTANSNEDYGIGIGNSNYYTITNNTANNNFYTGIGLRDSNGIPILDNIANYNGNNGIFIENGNDNIISGNIVSNNLENGIYLYYCDNNDILSNNVSNNLENGIYLSYSDYSNIEYNKVEFNNWEGIYLTSSDYNNILNNNVTNNEYGISLRYSDQNTIRRNTINNHTYGIYLYNSYANQISNNFFKGNIEDIKEVYYTYSYPGPGPFGTIITIVISIVVIVIVLACAVKFSSYNKQKTGRYKRNEIYKKVPSRYVEIPYKKESAVSSVTPQEEDSFKTCHHCGQKLSLEAIFCIRCGKKAEEDQVIPSVSEKVEDTLVSDIPLQKTEQRQFTPSISNLRGVIDGNVNRNRNGLCSCCSCFCVGVFIVIGIGFNLRGSSSYSVIPLIILIPIILAICGGLIGYNYKKTEQAMQVGTVASRKRTLSDGTEPDIEIYPETVLASAYRQSKFNLVFRNNSIRSLQGIEVQVSGPPQVKVISSTKYLGTISSGRTNNAPITIRPLTNGTFALTVTLKSSDGYSQTSSIQVQVGSAQVSPYKQQIQPRVEKPESPSISLLSVSDKEDSGRVEIPSKIEEKEIKDCPNCGQQVPLDALFCTNCGEHFEEEQLVPSILDIKKEKKIREIPYPKGEKVQPVPLIKEEEESKKVTEKPPTDIEKEPPVPLVSDTKEELPKEVSYFCNFCGMKLNKEATFCPQCGSRVKKK
ncbi:MAG: right-handed parallel beta-helix repeat-containing protein [Candidatus Hodarchaeales archaeon]|jgi:parallel beta-helix repeat protein